MSDINKNMTSDEKEARINALNQLLSNSVADVVEALEGGGELAEYTQLREKREAWRKELEILAADDNAAKPAATNATDPTPDIVLATISNTEIIEQLTGVISQQAGIINQLHGVVVQLGAVTSLDEEIKKLQKDTAALVGEDTAKI